MIQKYSEFSEEKKQRLRENSRRSRKNRKDKIHAYYLRLKDEGRIGTKEHNRVAYLRGRINKLKWQREHIEDKKEYDRQRYLANKEEINARVRNWRLDHREQVHFNHKMWYYRRKREKLLENIHKLRTNVLQEIKPISLDN